MWTAELRHCITCIRLPRTTLHSAGILNNWKSMQGDSLAIYLIVKDIYDNISSPSLFLPHVHKRKTRRYNGPSRTEFTLYAEQNRHNKWYSLLCHLFPHNFGSFIVRKMHLCLMVKNWTPHIKSRGTDTCVDAIRLRAGEDEIKALFQYADVSRCEDVSCLKI